MRLFALRGAISVPSNDAETILSCTQELMEQLVERNGLSSEDVVSAIFTCTDDLDAEFPAVAARQMGWDRVPLLCTRELAVPGALPMVIRVMLHYYADDEHISRHVYLGEARKLRRDLSAAQ
jgi:chorismate mutase